MVCGDDLFESELGEDVKMFLIKNPLFGIGHDLKKIKWILAIDPIQSLDVSMFNGLFDPEIDYSKYVLTSYFNDKSKYTMVGFEDDCRLYTFLYILRLTVQDEDGKTDELSTFKQRIK